MSWLRLGVLVYCALVALGQTRMVLVYLGVVRSPLGVASSPGLLSVASRSALKHALFFLVLLFCKWPVSLTFLVGIAALFQALDFCLFLSAVPPYSEYGRGRALANSREAMRNRLAAQCLAYGLVWVTTLALILGVI